MFIPRRMGGDLPEDFALLTVSTGISTRTSPHDEATRSTCYPLLANPYDRSSSDGERLVPRGFRDVDQKCVHTIMNLMAREWVKGTDIGLRMAAPTQSAQSERWGTDSDGSPPCDVERCGIDGTFVIKPAQVDDRI